MTVNKRVWCNKEIVVPPPSTDCIKLYTYKDNTGDFRKEYVLPDSVKGIYANVGTGTFFKSVSDPEILPQESTDELRIYSSARHPIFRMNYNSGNLTFMSGYDEQAAKNVGHTMVNGKIKYPEMDSLKIWVTTDNKRYVEIPMISFGGKWSVCTTPANEERKAKLIELGLPETSAKNLSAGFEFDSDMIDSSSTRPQVHGIVYGSAIGAPYGITLTYCGKIVENPFLPFASGSIAKNTKEGSFSSWLDKDFVGAGIRARCCAGISLNDSITYIPTTIIKDIPNADDVSNFAFLQTPIEKLKNKLIERGVDRQTANVLAKGCFVCSSSTSNSNTQIFHVYFKEILTQNISISLYFGDYYFLSAEPPTISI